ncbi:MAG: Co2+/Mg2+ efflux protein ApaG [Candidatus Marinimicrobia bacterium]|nr:Co2+/Mg2+ efflux protein ApaG [Candidatus Neomarinimicrobiota bacterium]
MNKEKIDITVTTEYLPQRSDPSKPLFFFVYKIKITNNGNEIIQLKNRYWHITDAKNNFEEIRGPGVVGDQPILNPGSSYKYKSYCPLKTEFGVMHGHFGMTTNSGKKFNAKVNPFRLSVPHSVN